MSAFIVSDNTINGLVSFLNRDRTGMASHAFGRLGYVLTDSDSMDKLASDLYLMNCDAVDDRYGKGVAASDTAEADVFQFEFVNMTAIQAYKAARCLLYQCSEGNVPERDLYKALDSTIGSIANYIISKLPEYDTASWG